MRAVFSLTVILVVAAIVLFLARRQLDSVRQPALPAATPAASATEVAPRSPQAVGRQVQDAVDDAARRSAEAASAAER
ncbi:MAG: hypothetical protein DI603_01170 [Roseateles depolymerans]|uniref:Uncharacterized protein n=1 Tax=Roseateles depolymerans TaxID=76731 RepID=A0A2W5E681_9BURK|nr:MAG: hypothetical protein DI603_01170 [Roseateles depolymerans]